MSSELDNFETDEPKILSHQDRLALVIENARNLPTVPRVAVRVANEVDSPSSSAKTVGHALAGDPLLTATVLRMANSVFYGAPRRVSTVTDAIVLLGMQTIRSLALAASCYEPLDRGLNLYGLQRGELWRHSFCVGFASEVIAKRLRYTNPEEAFVAGLLHDIGKVVIDSNTGEAFGNVLEIAYRSEVTFDYAERMSLNYDHAEVGAALLSNWQLPDQLTSSVQYHHTPSKEPSMSKLTAMVHVADLICLTLGICVGTDSLRYSLDTTALSTLKLSDKAVAQIMMKVLDCLDDADLMH